MKAYVLAGPADGGNRHRYLTRGLVPAGKFAVVQDAEYLNGGQGPCNVAGNLFGSREHAEDRARAINNRIFGR